VHYWGTDALSRLRGMFAFALWDTHTRELLCARDPFGIKPLYLATGPAGTAVGSEKKCLLELAASAGFDLGIDERAVQHYTVLQYVPSPRPCTAHPRLIGTATRGIVRALPGGHPILRAAVTAVPFGPAPSRPATTDHAVREDSSPSTCAPDVTVGAFLSGGFDSTAIAALAAAGTTRG
jgi:asparagine synthase (glutamine-hydrolysing)